MRSLISRLVLAFSLILCFAFNGEAKVKLPALVADGMVLQRDQQVQVWGFADPGEEVTIRFMKKRYRTHADTNGCWNVQLPPMKAGGPYAMTINDIELKDILIGDVWLCSGQSNMETTLARVMDMFADEIQSYSNTKIRHIKIPLDYNFHGMQHDTKPAPWQSLSPEHLQTLTAVPYFFAKFLYEEIEVPIGIINSSVGGSPAEAWIGEEHLKEFPHYLNDKRICESEEYISTTQRLQSMRGRLWTQLMNEGDKGLREKWIDPSYDDTGWDTTDMFAGWGRDEKGTLINGSLWFRKTVDLPSHLAGKDALLRLGCIVDADSVFVNGIFVGNTTYQYPPRKYPVPGHLLKAGKNTIVIRLISNGGMPHFVEDKPYKIVFGKEEIDLEGQWKYRIGNRMLPMPGGVTFHYKPTGLYNAMIAPLQHCAIKGVIWYQGESNTGRYKEYYSLMTSLINDWRSLWKSPELPFLLVQLPNFMRNHPGESHWAGLRDVQLRLSQGIPHTAMTVNIDLGEWNDIHPLNKKDVGYRLSLQARKLVYGDKKVIADGPVYESARVEGNKMILTFRSGTNDFPEISEPDGFVIAGDDGKFLPAKAKMEQGKVIVWNDDIARPVKLRYAWANNPEEANLRNKAGLPASPFQVIIK